MGTNKYIDAISKRYTSIKRKRLNNELWRCDLKSPCVKFCESKNNKHQCGVRRKDKMGKLKIATLFTEILIAYTKHIEGKTK